MDEIDKIIQENADKKDQTETIRRLYFFVQKFPYKVCSFDGPLDLAKSGFGDCRHKQALLYELYSRLGLKVRKIKVLFDWKDLPLPESFPSPAAFFAPVS